MERNLKKTNQRLSLIGGSIGFAYLSPRGCFFTSDEILKGSIDLLWGVVINIGERTYVINKKIGEFDDTDFEPVYFSGRKKAEPRLKYVKRLANPMYSWAFNNAIECIKHSGIDADTWGGDIICRNRQMSCKVSTKTWQYQATILKDSKNTRQCLLFM